LNQKELPVDAVKSMAHDLPERKSVWWAAQSARKVANSANTSDFEAIQAAETWVKNPTSQTQKLASVAASKTDFQTPGPWAAQAAAWAGAGGGLSAHAVAGAVLLAAAQAGKPISAPAVSAPTVSTPELAAKFAKPEAPQLSLPVMQKPALTPPPQVPAVTGPDGLTLTPAQRAEMTKNVDPYIKLGCDVSHGRDTWGA